MANVSTLSLSGLAEWIVARGRGQEYRAVLGFVSDVSSASDDEVAEAIRDEPALTGGDRADALLAAVGEHVAFHRQLPIPGWCQHPPRFLPVAWFPVDLPSIRVRALVSSPASFWRRGIYIDRCDLDRV